MLEYTQKKRIGFRALIICLSFILMALGMTLVSCDDNLGVRKCTVTFNANGGYGVVPNEIHTTAGSSITLPNGSRLSKDGYSFNGWNTYRSGMGTNYYVGETYKPKKNITLYANWIIITPGTPTGIIATAISSSSISISWYSVSEGTGYKIYRSTSSFGNYSYLTSTSSTSYTNTGLLASTTYYYKVSAYNSYSNAEGPLSNYTSATTLSSGLGTPTGVTLTAITSSSITVSWSLVSGAIGYNIYRSASSSGTYTQIGTVTTTSYTNTGLSANTTYYYKVSAYISSNVEGEQSSIVSATTLSSGSVSGTEANPISLTAGVWTNGSVISSTSVVWYSFYVTSGTTYYIWWNDSYQGDGTKTSIVQVSAYTSTGTPLFLGMYGGWTSYRSFTASSSGTVKIKVEPYNNPFTGTFAIAYKTNSTRP